MRLVLIFVVTTMFFVAGCTSSLPSSEVGSANTPIVEPLPTAEPASADMKTPSVEESTAEQAAEEPVASGDTESEATPATPEEAPTNTDASREATLTPAPAAATSPPIEGEGTVLAAKLNVRSSPGVNTAIVGELASGQRVQIVAREGSWLQIVFPDAPQGLAWTSSNYVAIDGEPTPVPPAAASSGGSSPSSQDVPAPKLLSHEVDTYSWQWTGANALADVDWYFDIQIYRGSGEDPYHILVAEPGSTTQDNGVWSYQERFRPECNSFWLVQIAQRVDGRYAGWLSPKSDRLPFGPTCTGPTPTPCRGCGG